MMAPIGLLYPGATRRAVVVPSTTERSPRRFRPVPMPVSSRASETDSRDLDFGQCSGALRPAEQQLQHHDGIRPAQHVRMVADLEPRRAGRRDELLAAHDHRDGGTIGKWKLL